ncbi:MAG: PadR family transcriptional regulator [Methanobacterium sp.]|nr:PadR family transcriptional regulator [Methanobacterium sp.]
MKQVFEKFEIEMRRGVMQLAVICLLDNEKYGYEIIKNLNESGLKVEEGTLYPLLRRLEGDELLTSRWETGGPRPRKYYVITDLGIEIRMSWLNTFKTLIDTVKQLESNIQDKGALNNAQ